ncbi:hypothetical protein FIU97_13190 [Roseivivax sp. THAF40]|nr:hypothetical protein FIV09_12900 [Roseivivax sp. THAF197b]QFT47530.1 hypothetical protein FIU97_13190 [Roseivivax sp. THAF40]
MFALMIAFVLHGGLLPFTHGNTYDAFIHMFFADSYHRSWFDVWEPRWYTGFATTSYPPGTHMAQAALMHVMPLRAAFITVQLTGVLLLVVGVYRFALIWVPARAAGYAAIALALSSAVSETVHLFGQLPTIVSLSIFLNALPYVHRWFVIGGWGNLAMAILLSAATTAAHHVTTIFGAVLFIIPLALDTLRQVTLRDPRRGQPAWRRALRYVKPVGRGVFLAILMIGAVATTVLPYWLWSISDPITQVPIPHGSRESFLERKDLGFIFFLLPWGLPLLALPYVLWKTLTTRLWPLGGAVLLCFVLGTGGTTPISRMILGGAFDILTLDRFTFWATILILPFLGVLIDSLLHGRSGRLLDEMFGRTLRRAITGGIFAGLAIIAVFAAILPTIRPTQPDFIDPAPIVRFLETDEHHRWRYLTLGFGDQFAYLSAQTTAQSVDGNYHSARRLPDLTRYSVERLENAKYLGVPGLGSLRQFLVNAGHYNLKYVFSNDAFYDPLLYFAGWNPLNRLQNGVVVWERPDAPPLPRLMPRREFPTSHLLLWGIVPPSALVLAALAMTGAAFGLTRNLPALPRPQPLPQAAAYPAPHRLRRVILVLLFLAVAGGTALSARIVAELNRPVSAEQAITNFFTHLDFRRFEDAYELLDPETRAPLDDTLFAWRWTGGLLASYGKLSDLTITALDGDGGTLSAEVTLDWLTALDMRQETRRLQLVRRDGDWYLMPMDLRPWQTPVRLQREVSTVWNAVGRRQPRPEADLHRDRLDRPRIAITGARLVRAEGKLSVVGQVTNADADPAHATIEATALAGKTPQGRQNAGVDAAHRLLPAEAAGFRVTFENVLSLTDAAADDAFDPEMFVPPEFEAAPDGAGIEARALVGTEGLYRGIILTDLDIRETEDGLVLEALASNAGTETATIPAVNALLYDRNGLPIWSETGFVESNLYPGQSAPIRLTLPACRDIEVVASVAEADLVVNASRQQIDIALPGAEDGTLTLAGLGGCGALRLHLTAMTYEPLR